MKQEMDILAFAQEKNLEPLWLKRLSFTSILVGSNLLQTLFTKTLNNMTSKQWLLLVITQNCPYNPTLSEVGKIMGCSRQNVKQIAEILKKNGYLDFTKQEGDKNTVRLVTTKKWEIYCQENGDYTNGILEEIFEGFSEEELVGYFQSFNKVMQNIEKVNKKLEVQ